MRTAGTVAAQIGSLGCHFAVLLVMFDWEYHCSARAVDIPSAVKLAPISTEPMVKETARGVLFFADLLANDFKLPLEALTGTLPFLSCRLPNNSGILYKSCVNFLIFKAFENYQN